MTRTMVRRFPTAMVAIGLVLGLSAPAWAVAIYTYTGNPFTTAPLPYTFSDYVTVSMTLTNPIAPSQNLLNVVPDLVTLTMSDGVQTLDLSNPNLASTVAAFSTDVTGTITGWSVGLFQNPPGCPTSGCSIQTVNIVNNVSDEGIGANQFFAGDAFNSADPGVWTLVPEPTTVTLLAFGLVAMVGVRGTLKSGRSARPHTGTASEMGSGSEASQIDVLAH